MRFYEMMIIWQTVPLSVTLTVLVDIKILGEEEPDFVAIIAV